MIDIPIHLPALQVEKIETTCNEVTLVAHTYEAVSYCPECGVASNHVHSGRHSVTTGARGETYPSVTIRPNFY